MLTESRRLPDCGPRAKQTCRTSIERTMPFFRGGHFVNQADRSSAPQPGIPRRRVLAGLAGVGVAAGGGSLLAGCSSTSSVTAGTSRRKSYGGNLQVGLTGGSSSDTLDPHKGVTDIDISRIQTLYEPLVTLDIQAKKVVYLLAEEISPQGGSLTDWVIRLRPGVTFHDGRPFTADDVLFSFHRIITLAAPGKIFMGPIDIGSTKKLDSHTVLVKLTSPVADYAAQLAAAPFDLLIAPATLNPARPNGTGAFRYQSFTPGQRSVFTRHPHYWQHGLPYAGTLTITDFPSTVSLADALTTGQIHAAGTLDPPQVAALSNTGSINVVVSSAGSIIPFTMRVDQPPFTDVRVRQAMRLLVNRPQMIDSALDSYGTAASDVFSPYDPDFDHSLVRQQDIPQAKFLLKQAGKEDLTVTLVTSPVLSGVVAMATVLAEQAKAAGVTITIKNVPPGTFFGPDYLQSTFSQDYYSYFPYLTQVAQSMLPSSPYNETHNNNSHYTSLYNQAIATADAGLRQEILHEMQQYDFTQGGYIIPAFTDTLDAYSSKITGYAQSRLGQPLMDYGFMNFAFAG
jgi:peptide/nickel transport system substrate-binding protein